jgi:AbrB family looped-hinge helix DNA binding protein
MPLLTPEGQVTIPEPIRREMGWKPGDALTFTIKHGEVVVSKVLDLDDLLGIVQVPSTQNGDLPLPDVGAWDEQREQAWDEEVRRFADR